MANAREARLNLTAESVMDPDIMICDAHHHLWYPVQGGYSLEEFRQDISGGHKLVLTVFIESRKMLRPAGPPELQPVGETEFVRALVTPGAGQPAGANGVAAGIVGFADLTLGNAVIPVLEAHMTAGGERFRGVRYSTTWDANPGIKSSARRGIMASPEFRAGFACLQRYNLSFDAWLYHPQLQELSELAQAFPDTPIILDHTGGPLRIGSYAHAQAAVFQEWKKGISILAKFENMYVKLGGVGMELFGFGWHNRLQPPDSAELAEKFEPYFNWCIERFGTNRCMFESNFPVDKRAYSYTILWNAFKRFSKGFSIAEKQALFCGTAKKAYRLHGAV